jgi:hypothetical protein
MSEGFTRITDDKGADAIRMKLIQALLAEQAFLSAMCLS